MQLFDRTLGQWLEHWAEETPDKEYIVYSDRNLERAYRHWGGTWYPCGYLGG